MIYLATAAKLDLVPIKPDSFVQTEFARRHLIVLQNEKFWYVRPEDYIISKLNAYMATKSERQLADLVNVLKTQKDRLDLEYIRRWSDHFNTRTQLEFLL